MSLVAAPAVEPVTLAEAKSHLRVDITDEDSLITNLIVAARRLIESLTDLKLINQTWKLVRDDYPDDDELKIPVGPLSSVVSIKTTDGDGNEETFSSSEYIVDADSLLGRIVLKDGSDWPSPDAGLQEINAVEVTFVAGHGTEASDVPEELKLAVKMLVGHWYENREATVIGGRVADVKDLPMGVRALISSYKLFYVEDDDD